MRAAAAKRGKIVAIEMDEPELPAGHVYIRTEYSAISPGTEMSMAKRSGEQPIVLGYSAVGLIERVGEGVQHLQSGQRVACYGAPYVRHAEKLAVPANLVAAVPDHVRSEEAAFAGLGAIAIHALRMADLRFGESAVIVGLGILGQIIAQIASAAAYNTFGLDLNPSRVELLKQQGIPHAFETEGQLEERLKEATGGIGADSVLLCVGGAGEPLMNSAMRWIRDRGKVVIVGDLKGEFSRELMFQKEAQVLISRAGGPGRYDFQYERENRDYPIGYVRWTEGRNTAEYIRLLADQRIDLSSLITGIFPIEQAEDAYEHYKNPSAAMGVLLKY